MGTHENFQHAVGGAQFACDLSPHDCVAYEVHLRPAEEQKLQSDSAGKSKIVYTAGEIFPDGSIIELISLGDDGLGLLLWKDQDLLLRPQIHNGREYRPLVLPANVQREMRFPRSAIDFGTSSELLEKISNLFETYVGLTPPQIPIATAWVLSTWFPECWWRAPDLVITGWNMDLAVTFLRLLACLTRHPLMLTGVERATLRSLPMQVFPTLLINQPEISPRLLEFFRSSNYSDIVVPGTGRDVCAIAGSKAIFLGTNATENGGFRISLPAAHCRSAHLTDFDCRQITDEFQGQLLMYRFRYFSRVCAQDSASPARPPGSQLVPLQACIQDDMEFSARVAAMVESREQDACAVRARKPEVAMVEVLWAPSHNSKELKIKEITRSINTLNTDAGRMF